MEFKDSSSFKKSGFTLVELIVVITVLTVLGTIAFISLTGYNNDAKNGKVISDLRNLAGALEVVKTTGNLSINESITNTGTVNTVASSSILNNSGATLGDSETNYMVGNVDFTKIKQVGKNFKDPNSFDENQDYVYAIAFHPDFSYFQFAGQIYDQDIKKVRLSGTYARRNTTNDVVSIVSSRVDNTPVTNNSPLSGDLYQ